MSTLNENRINRSGRTSSQRSIYDYPEHLNPFYEDENHKRLRFWKINSENSDGRSKKSSRSNSFSFDGLKELWSFKSFRSKKKSSTLGITKTSESPPMLRRDDDADHNYNNTAVDSRFRHTIDVGLSNNFQRNTAYRSSLQDITSRNQHVFFTRNHRYRNTVQNGNLAFQSQMRASTPALQTRYIRPALSRGSSQTSVSSSNPFENDDGDTVSQSESVDSLSVTRSGRKKRRAPQPPTSSTKNMVDKSVTIIEENSSEAVADGKFEDSVNIINLTAEIESFVKTAATDNNDMDDHLKSNEKIVPISTEVRQSPENNDFYAGDVSITTQNDKLSIDKIQNLGSVCDYELLNNYERSKCSPVKILIREATEEDNEVLTKLSDEVNDTKVSNERETVTSKNREDNTKNEPIAIVDDFHFHNDECNTPTSLEVENILENENRYSINSTITSLRITESFDDLPKQLNDETSTYNVSNIPLEISPMEPSEYEAMSKVKKENSKTSSRFEIRTVPLKNFSPTPIRKNSCSEIVANMNKAKEAPPTPSRRNRTVKEIIESINKSQSLLKFNRSNNKTKDEYTTAKTVPRTSFNPDKDSKVINRNLNDSTAKNYFKQKNLFAEVSDGNGNRNIIDGDNDGDDRFDSNDIPLCVARYNEVSKNNSILFKKCMAGRDRHVRSAKDNDEKSNVEWNPVPKPRRHKHIA